MLELSNYSNWESLSVLYDMRLLIHTGSVTTCTVVKFFPVKQIMRKRDKTLETLGQEL